MAEIKVAIKGDDADFKAKLAESGEEAKKFGENVKGSLDGAKDAAADLLKEHGFGGVVDVLKGGEIAAAAFGTAIVAGLASGIEKAIEFQKQVRGLAAVLGPAQAGMAEDLAKWVESQSGATGSVEANMAVMHDLLSTKKLGVEEAKRDFLDIQNIVIQTGGNLEEFGRAYAEMITGGEIPKGFFKQNLAIQAATLAKLPGGVPGAGGGTADQQDEALAARVKEVGGGRWLLKNVLPFIAPGGEQAPGRIAAKGTTGGQIEDVMNEFQSALREMGTELLPDVNVVLKDMKEYLPSLQAELKSFGSALHEALELLRPKEGEHEALQSGLDKLNAMTKLPFEDQLTPESIWNAITKTMPDWLSWATDMKAAAAEHKAAAEALHRAVNPQ